MKRKNANKRKFLVLKCVGRGLDRVHTARENDTEHYKPTKQSATVL